MAPGWGLLRCQFVMSDYFEQFSIVPAWQSFKPRQVGTTQQELRFG
jgi:hypothetical protein